MSDTYENMSDTDLDAAIYDSEPSDHGTENTPISPEMGTEQVPIIEEPEEQTSDSEAETDVDQTAELDGDSEGDSTDDDQTDDNGQETDDETDEAEVTDTDESEDKGAEADGDNSETTEKYQPLKANGKEYPIDDISELYKLASAGVGAQQKFQAIAGHKKSIMAAEKAGVDMMEAVNFMANYKSNPKDAALQLLKDNDIDPLDIDTNAKLEARKDYSVSDFEVQYDEVIGEIGNSPVFPKVQELLLNGWDEKSRAVFLDTPSMIKNLHEEMSPMDENGKSMFDLVSPIAEKMKLSGDSRSDYEIYMDARNKKVEEFQKFEKVKETVKTTPSKPKADNKAKKKAASPTGGSKAGVTTLDFGAMSDAELDAFLEKA
jgi:hypothetical protein